MKYIVNVESSIGWTEETDTLEEAITLIRELMETDKRYTFAGTTDLRFLSRSKDALMTMQVKWLWLDEQGKPHMKCKSIKQAGYTYSDWRKEQEQPMRREMTELLNKWDEITAMFK